MRRFHPAIRAIARIAATVLFLLTAGSVHAATCVGVDWPLWSDFKKHFVQQDGRVLDASTPQRHSSSEGQSYGMFFALIANDPVTFEKLWRWSVNNLSGGDVSTVLPAWIWGLADDGSWRVLDPNSASDADLWFVYALLEAGRMWGRPDYIRDATQLLALIEQKEIVALPGLGPMLLPGPIGFEQPNRIWQFNPSYLPVPVLRRLATASPAAPWSGIAAGTARLITSTTPKGFAADWVAYQVTSETDGRFVTDPLKGDKGSYDAIRVYLWAGVTPETDPAARPIRQSLSGMSTAVSVLGYPPESVATQTGAYTGTGPFGFSAALVPYLRSLGQGGLADIQLQRARSLQAESLREPAVSQRQPPYYDYVLSLFGVGWADGRWAFRGDGSLQVPWRNPCS